jgi:predicted nucleotidyltransferase
MNCVMSLAQFKIENIFLLEKKDNIIIDGYFTKIIYSNNYITLNGIYLKINLNDKIYNIENMILEYYRSVTNSNKKCYLSIYKQLKFRTVILKISGIWENSDSYGLTYKFLC